MELTLTRYIQHMLAGTLEKLEGEEIEKRMRKRYSSGAEKAILFDAINGKKLEKLAEHEEYRELCKKDVDELFSRFAIQAKELGYGN